VRALGRLLLGLIVLGLLAGFVLRSRVPRRQLPWVVAGAFAPALLHAVGTSVWAVAVGVEPVWVTLYAAGALGTIAVAWWWLRRLTPERPFVAPLTVPLQAGAQVGITTALGRAAVAAGAAVDVLPAVGLLGASVAVAAALLVVLPSRAHLPSLPTPRAPAWLRALGRVLRGRG
jgi:hypothetical protein